MSSTHFDIAIIGAGAAGLHLALAIKKESFFTNKRILILEKSAKDQNDRTWCFWEKGDGLWEDIVTKQWQHGHFFTANKTIPLALAPYRYKMIKSIDFYRFAKDEIASSPIFTWVSDDILSVETAAAISIKGEKSEYTADYVFDSRIPKEFENTNDPYTRLLQHFKGWVIRTEEDTFDPEQFTMMDFRLLQPETCSFTYVLPLNKREALVEFTLFSRDLLQEDTYDTMLKTYVRDILKIADYTIIEQEKGVIPMSDFPFEKYSIGKHIRIGTGGGWVKPTTGYSFKNCERNARKIVENLKLDRNANDGLISKKFRLYDSLFLDILNRKNYLGPALFETMYSKISVQKIFSFLDDQTNFREDLSIMSKFRSLHFIYAFTKYISRKWNT